MLDFDETPAEDVVAFFRGMYPKMNIFVAWKALETVLIDPEADAATVMQQAAQQAQTALDEKLAE